MAFRGATNSGDELLSHTGGVAEEDPEHRQVVAGPPPGGELQVDQRQPAVGLANHVAQVRVPVLDLNAESAADGGIELDGAGVLDVADLRATDCGKLAGIVVVVGQSRGHGGSPGVNVSQQAQDGTELFGVDGSVGVAVRVHRLSIQCGHDDQRMHRVGGHYVGHGHR